jgi:hypothetical protein
MDTWERFSRALEESKKVEEECGCEEGDTKSKKKIVDLRGMRTDINNAKNKLRSMGLKMSQELEGEQIDEIAPLIAGGLAIGGALAAGSAIKRAQDAAKSGVDAANKGQKVKPGIGIGNASYGMQRHHNQLRDAMKQMNSYEPEGELVDEGKKDLPQTKMYRKAGNLARQALSSKGAKKEKAMDRSAKIVSAITRETERKRFDEIGKSPAHNSNYKEEYGGGMKKGGSYDKGYAAMQKEVEKLDKGKEPATAKRYREMKKEDFEIGEGYIEEKSLSRAQQRFFGMVRAAQDGKMKSPSPEVAKAAKEMTKKQAHDFAATKHKGLPEKKEVKEEISLVEKMIVQYSPISEGKLDDLLSDIRGSGEDPNQSQKKRVLKKKSTQDNPEASGATEKRGKGSKTSRERQAVISGTTRVKAKSVEAKGKIEVEREKAKAKLEAEKERTNREKLKGERQKLAIEVDREKRTEKKTEKEKTAAEKSAERQKSLEQKDKQKRIEAGNKSVGDYEKEQAKKKQRRDELKSAFVRPSGGATATEKDSDLTVLSAAGSNIGSGIKALGKTAFNLGKIAVNRRAEKKDEIKKQEIRKKAESSPIQSETFSNWREEFIVEIDDVSADNDAPQKIIDVSKKKNKIEINPKLDEGVEIEESKK